jgi:hypothetical protein
MSTENSSEPVGTGGLLRSLSAWSVISLVLFALTLSAPLLLLVFWRRELADDPALGAEKAFLVFVCLAAVFGCSLFGVITGWIGIRRSRGYQELPWAGLALNSALLLLQLVLPPVLLAVSEPGAAWLMAPTIVILGAVFAALVGVRDFIGRTNHPVRAGWWIWFLGVACGTAVLVFIRLLMPAR